MKLCPPSSFTVFHLEDVCLQNVVLTSFMSTKLMIALKFRKLAREESRCSKKKDEFEC